MFKINNKDIRTTFLSSFCFLVGNFERTLFHTYLLFLLFLFLFCWEGVKYENMKGLNTLSLVKFLIED